MKNDSQQYRTNVSSNVLTFNNPKIKSNILNLTKHICTYKIGQNETDIRAEVSAKRRCPLNEDSSQLWKVKGVTLTFPIHFIGDGCRFLFRFQHDFRNTYKKNNTIFWFIKTNTRSILSAAFAIKFDNVKINAFIKSAHTVNGC